MTHALSNIINLNIKRDATGMEITKVTFMEHCAIKDCNVKFDRWVARKNGKSTQYMQSKSEAIAAINKILAK